VYHPSNKWRSYVRQRGKVEGKIDMMQGDPEKGPWNADLYGK